MKDEKDKDEGQTGTGAKNQKKDPGRGPGNNPRQDRLKRALRENLKRRKSQAKARGDVTMAPSNDDGVAPNDGSGKKPVE
jgi:hypothetical protein